MRPKFTIKTPNDTHLRRIHFSKVADLKPATLLKKGVLRSSAFFKRFVIICAIVKNNHRKVGKNPCRSITLATFLRVTLLPGCFSCFLNCINGTKSHKASHIHHICHIFFHYLWERSYLLVELWKLIIQTQNYRF